MLRSETGPLSCLTGGSKAVTQRRTDA